MNFQNNNSIQNLTEVNDAIETVVIFAKSKPDHTCKALAAILLSLQSAICGGGIEDWVAFSQEFGAKMAPIWQEHIFEVATTKELEDHTKALHTLQSALRASGKVAKLTSVAGKYVTLSYDGLNLRVQVAKFAKHTNVAQTSIISYHSQDFSTQALRIARCIFDASVFGGDITRAEIASRLGIQEGRVSARVHALLSEYKDGGYIDKSGEYRLVLTAPRLSKCVCARKVPNEAMRFEKPAPVWEQTELLL